MTRTDIAAVRVEIAERIEEAWDTLKRLPDRDKALLMKEAATWPTMLHTAAEHAAWKPMKVKRPPPTAKQIDRMHEVLDWLLALAKQERDFCKAVWLCCAERKKPAEAAKILGCHRQTARIWRDNGLERISVIRSRLQAA